MLEIVRAVADPDEQQRAGDAIDEEPEQRQKAKQRAAPLDQATRADAVVAQQPAGGRRGREVAARKDRAGAHRDPRHLPADRSRRLGEEPPEDDHVAEARTELEHGDGEQPAPVHVAD
jgi:hypothetical protein